MPATRVRARPDLPFTAQFGRTIATNMWDGYLSSNYNSLQVAVNRSFAKGLMLKGAYTYAKAIDYTDDDGWASVGWNWAPVFQRNRAVAGFDRTHILQIGWVYELPFGKGKMLAKSGVAAAVLGGWQVNGSWLAYTGTPFTVSALGPSLNAPNNTQTADQVNPMVTRLGNVGPGQLYYDPTAFASVTGVSHSAPADATSCAIRESSTPIWTSLATSPSRSGSSCSSGRDSSTSRTRRTSTAVSTSVTPDQLHADHQRLG